MDVDENQTKPNPTRLHSGHGAEHVTADTTTTVNTNTNTTMSTTTNENGNCSCS